MTRIDFYVLPDTVAEAARRFACRLAYKAVAAGHRVYVLSPDGADTADLDELMWTYPDNQFLPHAQADTAPAADAEVVIGHQPPPEAGGMDVLINLTEDVPSCFGRFERVAEIVTQTNRSAGRERYKHYRDRGYPLFHHDLNDWEAA